jgi:DMSO reductase anchor subunit
VHPSLSVILFTTLSGAGYGLLALLGLLAPLAAVPLDPVFALASLGLAFAAITAGLLSSMVHLGQPRRAWRAFSQWRSSWLSREGVASVSTYVPFGLFAITWIFFGIASPVLGVLSAAGAALTVCCTGMIYRSLKPVPRWHNPWVVPNYLALGTMSGSLWLTFMAHCFASYPVLNALALCAIVFAAALKLAYWRSIDSAKPMSSAGSATGLGRFGPVRLFEAPHTSENYLLKEMGFQVARKHAAKLRRIGIALGFCLPALLVVIALLANGRLAPAFLFVATALATLGVLVERWLFFAEARHAVTLYYGAVTV